MSDADAKKLETVGDKLGTSTSNIGMASSMSSGSGFILFNVLTFVYFILVYFTRKTYYSKGSGDGGSEGNTTFIYSICYFVVIALVMFSNNYRATKEVCHEINFYKTFLSTLFPWALIFGLVSVMLLMFPGWKAPFSNTFGYMLASIGGLNSVANQLFKNRDIENFSTAAERNIPARERLAAEAISHVYQNPSLLIDEVTPDNFNDFWNTMQKGGLIHTEEEWKAGGQVEEGPCTSLTDCKKRLYSLIVLKDVIAEAIWYWLAGNLTVSVTQNYILNSGCQTSAATMKKRHEDYLKTVKKYENHHSHPLSKDSENKTRQVMFN